MPMAGVNVGADWPVAVLVSLVAALFGFAIAAPLIVRFGGRNGGIVIFSILAVTALGVDASPATNCLDRKIGRASCRERV